LNNQNRENLIIEVLVHLLDLLVLEKHWIENFLGKVIEQK